MKKIELVSELQELIGRYKAEGKTVGFVPTMGALHEGHLSLVKHNKEKCDICVVSIFVNPTQFNNKDDYAKYPRINVSDIVQLETLCNNNDIVFVPTEKEMYPEADTRKFEFGALENVMEGHFRPDHFNGVAQIVSKLLTFVGADYAFFGEKDFQQLAIIRKLVKDFMPEIETEIVGCPTIREKDGLAMSSRNMLLTNEQRSAAPFIYKILQETKKFKGDISIEETKKWVVEKFAQNAAFRLEYFEISDIENLQPTSDWNHKADLVACIAAFMGEVRLIDNITY